MRGPARPSVRAALLALLSTLFAGACAHAPGGGPRLPPVMVVGSDTRWSGDVLVEGVVHVRKSATLTIDPGTRIRFAAATFSPGEEHEGFVAPGFKVEGRILALGTEEAPIRFTTADGRARPGSWDKLLFAFSEGSRFERCVFEGARYAFHVHFSSLEVSRCVFRDNEEGMRMGSSRVLVEDSAFHANEIRGINLRDCRNEIRGNLVFGNGDGIFLHSKDAASVIRGNAIYGNRGYDLRMGDLHVEDVDVSGNWWGATGEGRIEGRIYDGADLPGIGRARFTPTLSRPPVTGAEIRGVFVSGQSPVKGAQVVALATVSDGFFPEDRVGEAVTDADGLFRMAVPPGRWFVAGRMGSGPGSLFSFPGRNPVPVSPGERADVAMPAVAIPVRSPVRPASAPEGIYVHATLDGAPVAGATVQAFRPDTPDFRGPGEGLATTGESGGAILSLRPGRYLLAARKRPGGASVGVVEEGGMFGVWPGPPVEVRDGLPAEIAIPMFEKRGMVGGEDAPPADRPIPSGLSGVASIKDVPAAGYVVYLYRPGETVGRPLARSTPAASDGSFAVPLPADGEYAAFLRKSVPGVPGGVEEERIGPLPVRVEGGRLFPPSLRFGSAPR